jgi:hypothetical protein
MNAQDQTPANPVTFGRDVMCALLVLLRTGMRGTSRHVCVPSVTGGW